MLFNIRAIIFSSMWLHISLLVFALGCLGLFALAYRRVRHSAETYGFIHYWGGFLGAFIWEDLMIFSIFFMLTALLVGAIQNIRVGLLLLASFWIVRSAGETFYFFLQQFHRPEHTPHNIAEHFAPLHHLFGHISSQKCYIIMQIFWQTILAMSITALSLLLLHWSSIPAWL